MNIQKELQDFLRTLGGDSAHPMMAAGAAAFAGFLSGRHPSPVEYATPYHPQPPYIPPTTPTYVCPGVVEPLGVDQRGNPITRSASEEPPEITGIDDPAPPPVTPAEPRPSREGRVKRKLLSRVNPPAAPVTSGDIPGHPMGVQMTGLQPSAKEQSTLENIRKAAAAAQEERMKQYGLGAQSGGTPQGVRDAYTPRKG